MKKIFFILLLCSVSEQTMAEVPKCQKRTDFRNYYLNHSADVWECSAFLTDVSVAKTNNTLKINLDKEGLVQFVFNPYPSLLVHF